MPPRRSPLLTLLFLSLLGIGRSAAHDLGAMQVQLALNKDGSYRALVELDLESLPPGVAPADDAKASLDRFRDRVAEGISIGFDGALSRGALTPRPPSGKYPREIDFELAGKVPPGARAVTFRSALESGAYLLALLNEGESPQYQWLDRNVESLPFDLGYSPPPLTWPQVVGQYLSLGFSHIVPGGLDHILFVLGLFLLSRRWKPLLWQVTAFTLAHTLSLSLSIYGIVSVSPRIVEPLIAVSIVYVAVENLVLREFRPWRVALVFAFGLLHGLGFAGVLSELGLPERQFVPALLSFNVGVELGQLAVLTGAFLLLSLPFGEKSWYRRRVTAPLSIAIALVAIYWTVQRIA